MLYVDPKCVAVAAATTLSTTKTLIYHNIYIFYFFFQPQVFSSPSPQNTFFFSFSFFPFFLYFISPQSSKYNSTVQYSKKKEDSTDNAKPNGCNLHHRDMPSSAIEVEDLENPNK
jgi:hypothetical protein